MKLFGNSGRSKGRHFAGDGNRLPDEKYSKEQTEDGAFVPDMTPKQESNQYPERNAARNQMHTEPRQQPPEPDDDDRERTPEEKLEIERMISAYQKKKLRRRLIVLAALVVIAGGIFAAIKLTIKPPEVQQGGMNTPVLSTSPTPTNSDDDGNGTEDKTSPSPTTEVVSDRKEGFYTFALIGCDDGNGNTDTIMLGSYDDVNKKLNIVSIPRDTMVNVPWATKKVNTLYYLSVTNGYADDHITGFKEGIRDFTGFTLDSVIVVNINGFKQLVDLLGGVYFDVPINMNYDDPEQNLHIHFNKGYQYLNGEQALQVVRFRNNSDGSGYYDTGRIQTQQAFLKTVASQCLSFVNLSKVKDYATIFSENVTTDMSVGNLIWYGEHLLGLKDEDINFYTLPSEQNDSVRGMSYGSVYVDDWITMINDYLNPYKTEITISNVNLLSRENNKDSNRSNWGDVYSTSGIIAGGYDSFYNNSSSGSSSSGSSGSTTTQPTATSEPSAQPEDEPPATEAPVATDAPAATDAPNTDDSPSDGGSTDIQE